jgi:hypothetical protein
MGGQRYLSSSTRRWQDPTPTDSTTKESTSAENTTPTPTPSSSQTAEKASEKTNGKSNGTKEKAKEGEKAELEKVKEEKEDLVVRLVFILSIRWVLY